MATLETVKELRARTGCGIVDCKEALAEADDDIEQAIAILRKKGVAKAAKKAERQTKEGVVASYLHSNNKLGVLVALSCETDFVARNEKFQELARNIALHIAALDPVAISPADMPEDAIAAERDIALEQAKSSGKPEAIQEKIVAGKLKTFTEERALLTQVYVKDSSKRVQDLINEAIQELGENIAVTDFKRVSI